MFDHNETVIAVRQLAREYGCQPYEVVAALGLDPVGDEGLVDAESARDVMGMLVAEVETARS